MSKRTWIVLTSALLLGLLQSACGGGLPDLTPIPTLAPREGEPTPALADALQTPPPPAGVGEETAGAPEAVSLDEALVVFETNCQACHGEIGKEGGLGPALFASANIAVMSDADLRDLLVRGVEGTAMSSYEGVLSNAEIGGLVALIRSWQGEAEVPEVAEAETPEVEEIETPEAEETEEAAGVDLEAALNTFETNCQGCHGEMGAGGIGPSLANSEAIQAMSAEELLDIFLSGVEGTAMPGFEGRLEGEVFDGLVALIESWQKE